jgi:hypothetical protein
MIYDISFAIREFLDNHNNIILGLKSTSFFQQKQDRAEQLSEIRKEIVVRTSILLVTHAV